MNKKNYISQLLPVILVIGLAIVINMLSSYFHIAFDLTGDKRFTMTKPTHKLLNDVKDVVFINVLLEGDLPAGVKRLQNSVKEILDDFHAINPNVEYTFVNPNVGTVEEINKARTELAKDGIYPTNLRVKGSDETREILFYTYATVTYGGRTKVVNLVDKKGGVLDELTINNSISLLEFKFASAIQKVMQFGQKHIAFLNGHGELTLPQTADLRQTLRSSYNVGTFNLDSTYIIPKEIEMLIIAKPRFRFSEKHKFMIDQYIMNGGKVIWLLDRIGVNLDSLYRNPRFMPTDLPLNLDDQLFKYGARVQPNLVLDLQCTKIELAVDREGTKDLFDWYYHPVIIPKSDHPVVKGLDGVNLYFPSRIDTIKTKTNIKKTILLASSEYSREQFLPIELNFEILRYKPLPEKFNKPHIPIGVMLEGRFPSLYEARVTQDMRKSLEEINSPFKKISPPNKMLVVADGDIAKNLISPKDGAPVPLGYNRWVGYTFANKAFLVNAIEYMLDETGIIEARTKEVKLRLLDKVKAKKEAIKWQIINILVPLLLLGLFGFIFNWRRKRKYAKG